MIYSSNHSIEYLLEYYGMLAEYIPNEAFLECYRHAGDCEVKVFHDAQDHHSEDGSLSKFDTVHLIKITLKS